MSRTSSDLIIISGLPGSGKSTYGRKIARKFCMTYIDYDTVIGNFMKDIYEKFYSGTPYNRFRAEWRRCTYESFWDVVMENLRLGNQVLASAPLTQEHGEPMFFTKMRRKCGIQGRILSIIMNVPETVLQTRIRERGEARDEEKLREWDKYYKNQDRQLLWDPDVQILFGLENEEELYISVKEFLTEKNRIHNIEEE